MERLPFRLGVDFRALSQPVMDVTIVELLEDLVKKAESLEDHLTIFQDKIKQALLNDDPYKA